MVENYTVKSYYNEFNYSKPKFVFVHDKKIKFNKYLRVIQWLGYHGFPSMHTFAALTITGETPTYRYSNPAKHNYKNKSFDRQNQSHHLVPAVVNKVIDVQ